MSFETRQRIERVASILITAGVALLAGWGVTTLWAHTTPLIAIAIGLIALGFVIYMAVTVFWQV